MKKSLIYFIVPLLGLVVFGAAYWNFTSEFEHREEAKRLQARASKDAKLQEEARLREKAVKDALAEQDRRKKAKAEKDEKERKDREERDNAIQVRNKASQDARKSEDKVSRLTKEIKAEEEAIAKIEEDRKRLVEEDAFLKDYVAKIQASRQKLNAVLEKIETADRLAAEAARAAAAAAAANKK